MARVVIDSVCKSFGSTRVLQDVSLAIRDGEFMTLLGPSGCGKSTLLRIVAGLESQDTGTVSVDDANVDHHVPKERDVAMVFQSYALYPYMTIYENMALPLVMRRLDRLQRLPLIGRLIAGRTAALREIDRSVRAVADSLDIGELLHRKPAQLSGGQRQRAALGRAMVRDPKVFLMDEPLSNLDAKLRIHMRAELADLHRRLGATFVYVTHDQAEAMTMSDRVAVLMGGRILQVAPPGELYSDPVDLRVAEFIGSPKINVVPGLVATASSLRALHTTLPVAADAIPGTAVRIAIRCEHLAIDSHGGSPAFSGTIKHIENLGSDCFLHVAISGLDLPLIVRTAGDRARDHRLGETVDIRPDAERLLVFDERGQRIGCRAAATAAATYG